MGQDLNTLQLLASIETLPGVGGRRLSLFRRLLGDRVADALLHLPSNLHQFKVVKHFSEVNDGQSIIVTAKVMDHKPAKRQGLPYSIVCFDGKYYFDVIYFNGRQPYLQKLFPIGLSKIIVGKAERYMTLWKIIHPDAVFNAEGAPPLKPTQIIYPLTTGVTNACVTRAMHAALSRLPRLPEWIPAELIASNHWPQWDEALRLVHNPATQDDLTMNSLARQRLAYDELLSHQLGLHLARVHTQKQNPGQALLGDGALIHKLMALLPYDLTTGQSNALKEIFHDMAQPLAMARLVQGDVGCGKTIVALLAMVRAVEAGFQAALLAPTDILARQHAATLLPLIQELGLTGAILTGREKGIKRKEILEKLKSGEIHILMGTHAIIQDTVDFAKLGLCVVDEQHRFGVEQRLSLAEKGRNPHVLMMTATPIPRTMVLANYGDMDVSIIAEKPPGRQPVETKVVALSRLSEIIDSVKRPLASGAKIFWVCPLIDESETLDISAALDRYQLLQQFFGAEVGLVHGRMKAQDKDEVMTAFVEGNVNILVATTVIEVGVNVPAATIMIIEHAERFGLAQLHQLRGRIGRGDRQATCLLLYGAQLSETGKKRLATMRDSNDGFKIAEVDLKLRGGGDVLGTRQSGMPAFKLADFITAPDLCRELFSIANKDARRQCQTDPLLQSERGQALKVLLKLFGRDEAIKYTRS